MPFAQTQTEDQDPIQSFRSEPQAQARGVRNVVDHGLDCDCGVTVSPSSWSIVSIDDLDLTFHS